MPCTLLYWGTTPPAEKLTSAIRSVFSIPITPPDAPASKSG